VEREPASPEKLRQSYETEVRRLRDLGDRRELELQVLAQVVALIHGEDDPQRVLEVTLDTLVESLGLRAAWVFLGEQDQRRLHIAASRGLSERYLADVRQNGLEECLCPEVFWSGHRMQARNTLQCPRMPDLLEGLSTPIPHACVPLMLEGTSRGVLNVTAGPGAAFSDEELRFLETVGHQVCLAIERARHLRAERVRNQEAHAMAAVSKATGGSLDVHEVLHAVGESARELVGADHALLFLGSDPRRVEVAYLAGRPHAELRAGMTIDLEERGSKLLRRALEEGVAYRVDNCLNDDLADSGLARAWEASAAMVLPLRGRGRTFGILALTRASAAGWSDAQFDLAEALSAQASVALENARLYEEAHHSLTELREAQQRIIHSEKMAVLGTFASGLAHEVRNPLNSIALQLSILERRLTSLEAGVADRLRQVVDIIREEIRRLDALVNEFLMFSRTSRLQYQTVDLDGLVSDIHGLLLPEAETRHVALRHTRAAGPGPLLAVDAEKIKQVVINLVRNAIEAVGEGGTVTLGTGLLDGRTRIIVRDDGPGLPEGLDVFQLFVSTKPHGTGLGLSIAQQIVHAHGGELLAESQPGRGATFTVWLPTTAVDAAATLVGSHRRPV
jgi:signal transduction histidine kinase